MQCPNCGSIRVRRSLRRGLWEGLFLRAVFRAPFRCFDCGTRYCGSSLNPVCRVRRKHRSLASYVGLRGTEVRKYRQAAAIIVLIAGLILMGIWLVARLSESGAPVPPP